MQPARLAREPSLAAAAAGALQRAAKAEVNEMDTHLFTRSHTLGCEKSRRRGFRAAERDANPVQSWASLQLPQESVCSSPQEPARFEVCTPAATRMQYWEAATHAQLSHRSTPQRERASLHVSRPGSCSVFLDASHSDAVVDAPQVAPPPDGDYPVSRPDWPRPHFSGAMRRPVCINISGAPSPLATPSGDFVPPPNQARCFMSTEDESTSTGSPQFEPHGLDSRLGRWASTAACQAVDSPQRHLRRPTTTPGPNSRRQSRRCADAGFNARWCNRGDILGHGTPSRRDAKRGSATVLVGRSVGSASGLGVGAGGRERFGHSESEDGAQTELHEGQGMAGDGSDCTAWVGDDGELLPTPGSCRYGTTPDFEGLEHAVLTLTSSGEERCGGFAPPPEWAPSPAVTFPRHGSAPSLEAGRDLSGNEGIAEEAEVAAGNSKSHELFCGALPEVLEVSPWLSAGTEVPRVLLQQSGIWARGNVGMPAPTGPEQAFWSQRSMSETGSRLLSAAACRSDSGDKPLLPWNGNSSLGSTGGKETWPPSPGNSEDLADALRHRAPKGQLPAPPPAWPRGNSGPGDCPRSGLSSQPSNGFPSLRDALKSSTPSALVTFWNGPVEQHGSKGQGQQLCSRRGLQKATSGCIAEPPDHFPGSCTGGGSQPAVPRLPQPVRAASWNERVAANKIRSWGSSFNVEPLPQTLRATTSGVSEGGSDSSQSNVSVKLSNSFSSEYGGGHALTATLSGSSFGELTRANTTGSEGLKGVFEWAARSRMDSRLNRRESM